MDRKDKIKDGVVFDNYTQKKEDSDSRSAKFYKALLKNTRIQNILYRMGGVFWSSVMFPYTLWSTRENRKLYKKRLKEHKELLKEKNDASQPIINKKEDKYYQKLSKEIESTNGLKAHNLFFTNEKGEKIPLPEENLKKINQSILDSILTQKQIVHRLLTLADTLNHSLHMYHDTTKDNSLFDGVEDDIDFTSNLRQFIQRLKNNIGVLDDISVILNKDYGGFVSYNVGNKIYESNQEKHLLLKLNWYKETIEKITDESSHISYQLGKINSFFSGIDNHHTHTFESHKQDSVLENIYLNTIASTGILNTQNIINVDEDKKVTLNVPYEKFVFLKQSRVFPYNVLETANSIDEISSTEDTNYKIRIDATKFNRLNKNQLDYIKQFNINQSYTLSQFVKPIDESVLKEHMTQTINEDLKDNSTSSYETSNLKKFPLYDTYRDVLHQSNIDSKYYQTNESVLTAYEKVLDEYANKNKESISDTKKLRAIKFRVLKSILNLNLTEDVNHIDITEINVFVNKSVLSYLESYPNTTINNLYNGLINSTRDSFVNKVTNAYRKAFLKSYKQYKLKLKGFDKEQKSLEHNIKTREKELNRIKRTHKTKSLKARLKNWITGTFKKNRLDENIKRMSKIHDEFNGYEAEEEKFLEELRQNKQAWEDKRKFYENDVIISADDVALDDFIENLRTNINPDEEIKKMNEGIWFFEEYDNDDIGNDYKSKTNELIDENIIHPNTVYTNENIASKISSEYKYHNESSAMYGVDGRIPRPYKTYKFKEGTKEIESAKFFAPFGLGFGDIELVTNDHSQNKYNPFSSYDENTNNYNNLLLLDSKIKVTIPENRKVSPFIRAYFLNKNEDTITYAELLALKKADMLYQDTTNDHNYDAWDVPVFDENSLTYLLYNNPKEFKKRFPENSFKKVDISGNNDDNVHVKRTSEEEPMKDVLGKNHPTHEFADFVRLVEEYRHNNPNLKDDFFFNAIIIGHINNTSIWLDNNNAFTSTINKADVNNKSDILYSIGSLSNDSVLNKEIQQKFKEIIGNNAYTRPWDIIDNKYPDKNTRFQQERESQQQEEPIYDEVVDKEQTTPIVNEPQLQIKETYIHTYSKVTSMGENTLEKMEQRHIFETTVNGSSHFIELGNSNDNDNDNVIVAPLLYQMIKASYSIPSMLMQPTSSIQPSINTNNIVNNPFIDKLEEHTIPLKDNKDESILNNSNNESQEIASIPSNQQTLNNIEPTPHNIEINFEPQNTYEETIPQPIDLEFEPQPTINQSQNDDNILNIVTVHHDEGKKEFDINNVGTFDEETLKLFQQSQFKRRELSKAEYINFWSKKRKYNSVQEAINSIEYLFAHRSVLIEVPYKDNNEIHYKRKFHSEWFVPDENGKNVAVSEVLQDIMQMFNEDDAALVKSFMTNVFSQYAIDRLTNVFAVNKTTFKSARKEYGDNSPAVKILKAKVLMSFINDIWYALGIQKRVHLHDNAKTIYKHLDSIHKKEDRKLKINNLQEIYATIPSLKLHLYNNENPIDSKKVVESTTKFIYGKNNKGENELLPVKEVYFNDNINSELLPRELSPFLADLNLTKCLDMPSIKKWLKDNKISTDTTINLRKRSR